MKLRVGTRRSPLARTQTRQAMDELCRRRPGVEVELVEVTTTGDRIQDRPLREAGGKGLFLKELDEALVGGHIDCAVHSLKDVPTDLAPGTVLAAVLERADPRDLLLTTGGLRLGDLQPGAVLGTTSLRRQAQALAAQPGLRVGLLRGNVGTRLRKLAGGECGATFLAASGLARLGFRVAGDGAVASPDGAASGHAGVKAVALDPFEFVPAAGQGALGVTTRDGDEATTQLVAALEHGPSRLAVEAERAFARVFGGGCHLPLAAHAARSGDRLELLGLVASADGSRCLREKTTVEAGAADGDEALRLARQAGDDLGRTLLGRGAGELVRAAEQEAGS